MKIGIRAIGVHLPYLRYDRSAWPQVWEMPQLAGVMLGERTVANHDEDAITMAVGAAEEALAGLAPEKVGGCFFASTSSPYAEKLAAALIASVLDLSPEVRTADFGGSLRCGTTAVHAAADALAAGSASTVVVTTASLRLSEPQNPMEAVMGDAGAAVVLGRDDLLCEIEDVVSLTDEFTDVWRRAEEPFLRYDDEHYAASHGYLAQVPRVLERLFARDGLRPEQVARIVTYAPDGLTLMALKRRCRFGDLFGDDLTIPMSVGNAGPAAPFLELALALESAKPGERIVMVGYGDGADAVVLRTTERVGEVAARRPFTTALGRKRVLASYAKLLRYRELIRSPERLWSEHIFTSIAMLENQEKSVRPLYGTWCHCGYVSYPVRRLCPRCGSREVRARRLAHRGRIATYTVDAVFPSPGSPTPMAVIDLEGGGRICLQMTDCDPDEVDIDLPAELTFRKLHEAKGFNNYYWKAKPARNGGAA